MSTTLIWSNIIAYAMQIGIVVAIGALVPAVLRLREPRMRLLFWQTLLIACLALPCVESWRQQVVNTVQWSNVQVGSTLTAATVARGVRVIHRGGINIPGIPTLWLLLVGTVLRLGWLGLGFFRLTRYRRRGVRLSIGRNEEAIYNPERAELLISGDVAGPVTFGWHRPVVLLPESFLTLNEEMREAILCHELLHVERRDWLFTLGEELVRAALWFHPAIWWVLAEIQLAREQTVDQGVIEMTQARGAYVDALLSMATPAAEMQAEPDLALAPGFLRRRHLRRRLMDVLQEVRKTTHSGLRVAMESGLALALVAVACWMAAGAFQLAAAPQVVDDAPGVVVNVNGTQLMHRSAIRYPAEALAKGVEGTVVVQVKLAADGEVVDAAVLSGPDELRRGVLQSILTWHFDKPTGSAVRTVNVSFVRQPNQAVPAARIPAPMTFTASTPLANPRPVTATPTPRLEHIVVTGLSDSARSELLARLPVREGGEWLPESLGAVRTAVTDFDPHLKFGLMTSTSGAQTLSIGLIDSPPAMPAAAAATQPGSDVYRIGNGVAAPVLLSKVDPEYSEEGRAAKFNGTVELGVVVNTDGLAENITVAKSVGMGLDEKAIEAVQRWRFRPALSNGVPVRTRAMIQVNFRLLDRQQ